MRISIIEPKVIVWLLNQNPIGFGSHTLLQLIKQALAG